MGVSYTVHGSSQAECARELVRLCVALDAVCVSPPMRPPGGERWLARAVPVDSMAEAPPSQATTGPQLP